MKLPGVNIKVVLASVAIAMVLLFGGREALLRTSIAMPMDRAFSSMSEIVSHSVERLPYGMVVDVDLRNVDDLAETVRKITAVTSRRSAGDVIWIRINDTRNALLEDVYYQMHFDIQEAIATGSFSEMRRCADEEAREAGLSACKIEVDADNVYVALEDGEHQLYAVAPRTLGKTDDKVLVHSGIRWLSSHLLDGKAGADRWQEM